MIASIVMTGPLCPEVLRALLGDAGKDFEIIVVHATAGFAPVDDVRVIQLDGRGLDAAAARALGGAAARAQRVHIELCGELPDGPLEAALVARPALEMLRVLRTLDAPVRP